MEYLDFQKNKKSFEHFWYRARRDLIKIIFYKYGIANKDVLEIGCGAGSSLEAIAESGNLVVGCDINQLALAEASKRGFSVFLCDLENQKTFGKQYDVVCAFDVLEHINKDAQVDDSIRFSIIADWVDMNQARFAKALNDDPSRWHVGSIIIKATRQQFEEDINAFQSGVQWQEVF